ncbi:MAG TPA: peptidase M14, partial [Thermoanaerobaculia bacterium]|nr:peptidase M14 [Thermoanaerobaculia bacterium]
LAREMLAKDPALKAEWEERLKDPAFAADARARHRFFYRRTPWFDETVGLVPVYRLDAPLSVSTPSAGVRASGAGRE